MLTSNIAKESPQSLLPVCDVHVWKYRLSDSQHDASMAWLSPGEKSAIVRLKSYEDKRQYILTHMFLRKVIEFYTHLPPEQIQFAEGTNGRPMVKCHHAYPMVNFNLSHSRDYALLAISNEPCVGVDIEEVKPIDDFFYFLVEHFSKEERKWILAEKTEERKLSMLFTFWTMKEAILKALAVGVSYPLKKIDILSFFINRVTKPAFDLENFWYADLIPVTRNYKATLSVRAKRVNRKIFDYANSGFLFQ